MPDILTDYRQAQRSLAEFRGVPALVQLDELVAYTNGLLETSRFRDYCPNGLQVEGCSEVRKLVAGVSACHELVVQAAAAGADVILVHHGYFWRGEDPCVTGMKRRRLGALFESNASLLAYHLPLDAHPELGNNAQLARVLGFEVEGRFGPEPEAKIGYYGSPGPPVAADVLAERMTDRLGRTPLHIAAGSPLIRTIGWCTGAAQSYIEQAVELGLDAFVSGEVSEQTTHMARECGIHYFAAGHHATERYGVQALGEHLASRFGCQFEFLDIDNPV